MGHYDSAPTLLSYAWELPEEGVDLLPYAGNLMSDKYTDVSCEEDTELESKDKGPPPLIESESKDEAPPPRRAAVDLRAAEAACDEYYQRIAHDVHVQFADMRNAVMYLYQWPLSVIALFA